MIKWLRAVGMERRVFRKRHLENETSAPAKKKTFHFITLSHVICGSFSPSFLNLSLYVILDIPEVPAFKKRAQVFGRWSLYSEWSPFDLKSGIIEYRLTPPPPSLRGTYIWAIFTSDFQKFSLLFILYPFIQKLKYWSCFTTSYARILVCNEKGIQIHN